MLRFSNNDQTLLSHPSESTEMCVIAKSQNRASLRGTPKQSSIV
jgi:hypothetical protein